MNSRGNRDKVARVGSEGDVVNPFLAGQHRESFSELVMHGDEG